MAYLIRRFVRPEGGKKRIDFLINISNDGWFNHSSELPQHLDICVFRAIENRINVIQTDLDAGLTEFESGTFDHVIMSQTLQAVHYPDRLLDEMLRVGREGIITFPNFGHWRCRLQLLNGQMPVTSSLPNTWYNTPNIHLCTLKDFESLCRNKNIHILERTVVDHAHRSSLPMRLLPNLMGEVALYRFQRKK